MVLLSAVTGYNAVMISPEFIRELNERVDLAELIGAHVKLERRGANWVGLCPFHREKTPSFTVHAAKGFYHCFGCGAHGNAIGFIQQQYGGDFISAVERLAAMHGMTVVRTGGSGQRQGEGGGGRIFTVLNQAMRYYQQQLRDHEAAKDYLKQRGMSGKTAARYKIGYAPKEWDGLRQALTDGDELLNQAGLLRQKADKAYDYFRDRIIFPIIDGGERVCGFGGRALSDDNPPKYLNSSDSRYFSKRRLLFGLPQAMKAARDSKRLIICEGYMDVVMLAQGGFAEAAATMGTAATAEQMKKASRLAPNLYFAYDGDEAGQKGAFRALQEILPALNDGISVFFLFLPAGHDPDSYIAAHGSAAFEELLTAAQPLGDYLLDVLYRQTDTAGADGQAVSVMKAGGQLLRQLDRRRAPLWRDLLEKKLQSGTGISLKAAKPYMAAPPPRAAAGDDRRMRPQSLLFNLLCCLALKPELAETLPAHLPLPGATAAESELIHKLLEQLRWHVEDEDDEDGGGGGGNSGGGGLVLAMIEESGYRALAAQLRQSIGRRYARADDPSVEFAGIVEKLNEKHRNVLRRNETLEQLKAQRGTKATKA